MLKISQVAAERADHSRRQVTVGIRNGLMALTIASAAVLHSGFACALGLGEITLHSALDQPLNADIELLDTGGLSAEDIAVGLASPEAFARAGIERIFFFNDLRFTPVINGNRGVIHVVSRKPVSEPYLDFLVRVTRPNGDLLHEYTLLLDPPNSPAGVAATRSRNASAAVQAAPESRMPVAPPSALQGKHYSVAAGDTLGAIAKRLQAPGSKTSVSELANGIQALNPQAFSGGAGSRLQVGQNLLLPDAAATPHEQPDARSAAPLPANTTASAPVAAVPSAAVADSVQRSAEQLTATVIENQQLVKTVDDLKAQTQDLQSQMLGRDKEIADLQARLAEFKTPAATPVAAAAVAPVTPVAPVAPVKPVTAAPAAAQVDDDSFGTLPLLGAVVVLLLLLGLAYSVRRNRLKNQLGHPVELPEAALVKPAQVPVTPVFEVPAVAPKSVASTVSTPSSQRLAGAATDALDGASIYIAYGRFSEALGILRDALQKQPQRTDLRLRILELLGEQGDVAGFATEEQALLEQGLTPQQLQEIRARYPKLQVAAAPEPKPQPKPEPVVMPIPPAPAPEPVADVVPDPITPVAETVLLADLDNTAAAAVDPQPEDEFQLNLDDLSMDADWDLVDPFDSTPVRNTSTTAEPETVDPAFASNLTELPEVYEMPDEQFLSDFDEPQPILQSNSDLLDDAFLDGFMDDEADFDLLDLSDDEPLSKINQAQVLIDDGDYDSARQILLEVIEESDEEHQRTARDLLAGIH